MSQDHFFESDPHHADSCAVVVPVLEAGQVVGTCCGYPAHEHLQAPVLPVAEGRALEMIVRQFGLSVLWYPVSQRAGSWIGETDAQLRARAVDYLKDPFATVVNSMLE